MPTYTYQCKKCSHAFDVFHPMSAKPKVKCEQCQGACEKMIGTGAGIIFKGSGFYETDYKRNKNGGGKSTPGKPSGGSEKSESKSSSSSSESKSTPKTPAKD